MAEREADYAQVIVGTSQRSGQERYTKIAIICASGGVSIGSGIVTTGDAVGGMRVSTIIGIDKGKRRKSTWNSGCVLCTGRTAEGQHGQSYTRTEDTSIERDVAR